MDICDLTVKIGDFGSSRLMKSLGADECQALQMTLTGTWDYMPPEIRRAILDKRAVTSYNKTADIYSAAQCILTLYIGHMPGRAKYLFEIACYIHYI